VRRETIIGVFAFALIPNPASAHLISTGLGPVYDGAAHFALSPEENFPVIVLAFFAGLRGPAVARLVLFTLPGAWLVGGIARGWLTLSVTAEMAQIFTAASFLIVGGLLAAEAKLPIHSITGVAVLLGILHGALGGEFLAAGQDPRPLIGTVATIFGVVALAASFTLSLKRLWTIVAIRVAGSWLAALGLLLIGWVMHSRR